ncbi:malonyl-CoA decarboxylase domain-containing protein [Mycobacterium ulcerans]|uniref:malonyl-CoA decarboxylase domain-containing protein n=1 Tax=Mycobacterium ulcerans TaxID=1809 RepID=UPI001F061EA3|nr:malonyl-CoA decarboxylase family protein [Mycobacterium ulcerans]
MDTFATLICECRTLMSDIGEASRRSVAARALSAYSRLDDAERLAFYQHLVRHYDVDEERVRAAYQSWETAKSGGGGETEATALSDATEPARQQLLRRLNHAPGGTFALTSLRADLRRQLGARPELRPLDHDLHHLLASWFNRGFLRMEQVSADPPATLRAQLRRYERVHPMTTSADIGRRLEPPDRRIYAFLHPATGDVPLIFVEIALVRGIPAQVEPLLAPGPALDPENADTACLYSINNALDGLAGIHFGSLLIKQVIEQVSQELPHLTTFVTLSPIPGFRKWLAHQDSDDARNLRAALEHAADYEALDDPEALHPALSTALASYIADERDTDGRPIDPVARFHLSNGAAAWRVNWPADPSALGWRQSYGAMINYHYDPAALERRHETFIRHRIVAVDGPMRKQLDHRKPGEPAQKAPRG